MVPYAEALGRHRVATTLDPWSEGLKFNSALYASKRPDEAQKPIICAMFIEIGKTQALREQGPLDPLSGSAHRSRNNRTSCAVLQNTLLLRQHSMGRFDPISR